MQFVIVALAAWGLSALIRSRRESRRRREAERRYAEQQKLAREMREERQRRAEETAQRIALEREQMQQRRELERQRQEQERQAREQARQAERIARQEEQTARQEARLARLEQQAELAAREIAHYKPIVDDLRAEYDRLSGMIERYEARGLPCGGYRDQLAKVNERLYRAETKIVKAQFAKQAAETKLTA